jgi:hypothetical protein
MGKSAVGSMFIEEGVPLLDADQVRAFEKLQEWEAQSAGRGVCNLAMHGLHQHAPGAAFLRTLRLITLLLCSGCP